MGRKRIVKRKGILRHLEKEMKKNKGRKKEWRPRGELIPPNRTHTPKKGAYKRIKLDWKELLEEELDGDI